MQNPEVLFFTLLIFIIALYLYGNFTYQEPTVKTHLMNSINTFLPLLPDLRLIVRHPSEVAKAMRIADVHFFFLVTS